MGVFLAFFFFSAFLAFLLACVASSSSLALASFFLAFLASSFSLYSCIIAARCSAVNLSRKSEASKVVEGGGLEEVTSGLSMEVSRSALASLSSIVITREGLGEF